VKRNAAPADAFLPIGIFLLAFGYFFAFRRLGWFPQDEGVLYYQYLRTYHGQVPYRDFATGYPPLMYYLHAWLFAHVGISLQATRTVMAVVNATSAAALFAVARRLAPRGFALIPPALFLVMQPGDITDMDFHNSPYPLWYAVTFAVLGAWAMLRRLESPGRRRRAAWLVLTGVLGGLTFLSKQNAGIFFLWGTSGFLASCPDNPPGEGEREPPIGRAARVGYLLLIPLSALFLVRNYLGPITLALFVAPLAALAALGARAHFGPAALRRLTMAFACLALGFAAAFGPWLVYFGVKMGAGGFLRGLFFVGADIDRNLYIPFPPPTLATLVLLAPFILWTLLALKHEKKKGAPSTLVLAAAAFAFGAILSQVRGLLRLAKLEMGLGEICIAVSTAIDNIAMYLAPVVLAGAVVLLWRQSASLSHDEGPPRESFLCVLWIAASSFLLFYPRMDSAHLVGAAPLLYAVGSGLLPRLGTGLAPGAEASCRRAARLGVQGICLLAVLFVAGVKSAPKLYSLEMIRRTDHGIRIVSTPKIRLGLDRARIYFPVYVENQRLPIESFRNLIRYIRSTTSAREPIFAFPALPMIYFLSERDNPTRQDYFFGNNVSFREQIRVIRDLEKSRVRTVVVLNTPSEYFVAKGKDFTRLIWDYLGTRYYLDRRIGPFDVLRRYGSVRPGSEGRGRP